jgi:probable addiction module antidote protein
MPYTVMQTEAFAAWHRSGATYATPSNWRRRHDMNAKLQPFDMADLLDSEEAIAEYLSQVLADGDTDELLRALGHVAKARGIAEIAEASGLGRESLYKALRPGAKPRFETLAKVCHAVGVKLVAVPV